MALWLPESFPRIPAMRGDPGIAPDSFIIPLRVFDETGGATDEQIILACLRGN